MNRFEIYCTAEQTKKALELGAPIREIDYPKDNQEYIQTNNLRFYLIPTASQMLGWLEEQGLCIDADWTWDGRVTMWVWDNTEKERVYTSNTDSRQEATLAAVDAALDYLIKNKK